MIYVVDSGAPLKKGVAGANRPTPHANCETPLLDQVKLRTFYTFAINYVCFQLLKDFFLFSGLYISNLHKQHRLHYIRYYIAGCSVIIARQVVQ